MSQGSQPPNTASLESLQAENRRLQAESERYRELYLMALEQGRAQEPGQSGQNATPDGEPQPSSRPGSEPLQRTPSGGKPLPEISSLLPAVCAALLLTARVSLRDHGLPCPEARAILEATGAGRTRAYELAAELRAWLPSLERPVGRPRNQPDDTDQLAASETASVQDAMLAYVIANPGCISGNKRNRYTEPARHFVRELRERHRTMPLGRFAAAVHVPLKTLQQWIREAKRSDPGVSSVEKAENRPEGYGDTQSLSRSDRDCSSTTDDKPEAETNSAEALSNASAHGPENDPRIQTVLSEYKRWRGSFSKFCDHIVNNCYLSYGRTTISNILSSYGERFVRRRSGRSPDECALRSSFETFFPGAQWVGDGHEIVFELNGESFKVNLELFVDAYSSALMGADVGAHEDSNAVISAYKDGVATAGHEPIASLLDNRSSNHTEEVQAALGESLLTRSTLGRAQNKAHVEGAFGLFQQTAPPLQLSATNPRDLVTGIVALIVMVWARTLNSKKLPRRGNRSRIDLYRQDQPSPEEIQQAHAALKERQRRQEKAHQTRIARQNPIARQLLEQAFARLGLSDSDGNVQLAIAGYPLDTIIEGIATYEAKKSAKTLPESAGARYLLGIVKNINFHNEHRVLVEQLLKLRIQARDMLLDGLTTERDVLQTAEPTTHARIDLFVDRALRTDSLLARLFWLRSTAEQIHTQPESEFSTLLRRATGRIATTYRTPATMRERAICELCSFVFPLA